MINDQSKSVLVKMLQLHYNMFFERCCNRMTSGIRYNMVYKSFNLLNITHIAIPKQKKNIAKDNIDFSQESNYRSQGKSSLITTRVVVKLLACN